MQCTINASSREGAEYILRSKIRVDKIKEVDEDVERLKKMFGMK